MKFPGPTRQLGRIALCSDEGPVMGLERRGRVRWSCFAKQLDDGMTSKDTTDKPFKIEKRQVYEAYQAVKSNKGAADDRAVRCRSVGQPLQDLESDELGQLLSTAGSCCRDSQKVWRREDFRCAHGRRSIAHMVVKQLIEPDLDSFLPDSYGYRPRKSALDAVGVTRERCWLKFDIRGLFDNLPHDLL